MSKITKFVDMMMNFPNRFRVDGVQKTIVEDWDITQQGTKNKAEYFNEIEKQTTFDCLTNRVIDGSKEVYEMDLEGYPEFGEYELKFRAFFQTTNTTTDCYVRFYAVGGGSFIEYPIRFYKGNVLTAPSIGTLAQKKFINFKILEIGGIKYAVIDFPVLDITSTTDGIAVANGKDLTLNVVNDLTNTSATKPLSANMGKHLEDTKFENIGTAIPAGVDLNTYRTCGHYRSTSNDNAGTILNSPFGGGAFTLIVDSISGGDVYVVQTATEYIAGKMKTRLTIDSGVTWTPWVATLTENSPTVPVGGILVMADNTNPADKYPGTTWSLPISGSYPFIIGGNQTDVLYQGGSNSKTIAVANLPAFTVTRGTMEIAGKFNLASEKSKGELYGFSGALYGYTSAPGTSVKCWDDSEEGYYNSAGLEASRNWTGSSSSVGSGTALDITPAYTKLVFWKRNS